MRAEKLLNHNQSNPAKIQKNNLTSLLSIAERSSPKFLEGAVQAQTIFLSAPQEPRRRLIGITTRLRRHDELLRSAADGGTQEFTAELVVMLVAA